MYEKKILVMGGTGAMGMYLVPLLSSMGYTVDVPSLIVPTTEDEHIHYFYANCKDPQILDSLLANDYEAIYDFLIYPGHEFEAVYEKLLQHTKHYIFFSTYRVYAGESPITESSPRLLDVSTNKEFLAVAEHEYSLYKAMAEDVLRKSAYKNYTIVRPSITYSKERFQLVTCEADTVVHRAMAGKTLLLPETAISVQGTMTWAGDTARMLAAILLNENAYGETYTLATAEHHAWGEIAEYYRDLIGLKYEFIPEEDYLSLFGAGNPFPGYQLRYDRLFERKIDNTKILTLAGMKQSELMPLYEGLKKELGALPKDFVWNKNGLNDAMDAYLNNRK